jgi:hypothetical protein
MERIASTRALFMDPYVYQDLPSGNFIRLLCMSPGNRGEEIVCSLHVTPLDELPPYTALSYCWGKPVFDHIVCCEGKEIKVTKNLYSALQRMRLPDEYSLVWVDAICINQSNIWERGHQVGLMRNVYSEAAETLVYLGENTFSAQLLQAFLSRLLEVARELKPGHLLKPSDFEKYNLPASDSHEWRALCAFFSCDWFRRIWIIQEFTLSPIVFMKYGDWTITGDAFEETVDTLQKHCLFELVMPSREPMCGAFILTAVHRLVELRRSRRMMDLPDDFDSFLYRLYDQQTSDPRDYIYGFLGFAEVGRHLDIQPDYSLDVSEVYLRTCHYLMKSSGEASFLSITGPPCDIIGLPSWVPDWSNVRAASTLDIEGIYNAGCGLEQNWRLTDDKNVIVGRGLTVDTLTIIGSISFSRSKNYVEFEWMKQYFTESEKMVQNSQTIEDQASASRVHFELLTMESTRYRDINLNIGHYEALKLILYDSLPTDADQLADLNTKAGLFVSYLPIRAFGRRICVTAAGTVGQVPTDAQTGDKICIFAGMETPFIIREHPTKENCHLLIGDCYIRGLMHRGFHDEDVVEDIYLA